MNAREKWIEEQSRICDKACVQISCAEDEIALGIAKEIYGDSYKCNNGVAYFMVDAKRVSKLVDFGCPLCKGKMKPFAVTYQEYLQDTDHYACPAGAFDILGFRTDYRCSKCGHVIGIEFL